jgi:taurine transport system permease protein
MFVGIIVLGVTGVVLDWMIKLVENRVVHWRGKF